MKYFNSKYENRNRSNSNNITKSKNDSKDSIRLVSFIMIGIFIGVYGWMTLCHVGVQFYVTQFIENVNKQEIINDILNNSVVFAFISYVGMEIILLKVAYLMMKKHDKKYSTIQENKSLISIGLEKNTNNKKHFAIGLYLGFLVFIISLILNIVTGSATFKVSSLSNIFNIQSIGAVLIILVGMVFPAVCEEIVFRGIIQNRLMKKFSTTKAILISTVCFSFMHIGRYFDIITLAYILFPGVLLGYLFAKTKSLYMSIGLHFSWNVLCSLLGEGSNTFSLPYVILLETNNELISKVIACIVYFVVLVGAYLRYKNNISGGSHEDSIN